MALPAIVVAIILPFFLVSESDNVVTTIPYSALLLTVFLLPQLLLHLNYYFTNKGDIFIYDGSNKIITLDHKGVSNTFELDEIDCIQRFMSHALADSSVQWYPWDGYNHSIIYLKNGERFIVTSLLVPNLNLPVNPDIVKEKKSFYRWASYSEESENSIPEVFMKTVKTKSNKELQEIVMSKGNKYSPDFISAAKRELVSRGEV